jgi:hypothetical protein
MLAACKSNAIPDSVPTPKAGDPPVAVDPPLSASTQTNELLAANLGQAMIQSAEYTGGTGTNRTSVRILGRNFNVQLANESDCLESPDGAAWAPCVKLVYSSANEYDIIVRYSSEWPRVFVKVRGSIGLFSNAALIRK